MTGLSITGSSSLGTALVTGSIRVPQPAANTTALRTFIVPPVPVGSRLEAGTATLSRQALETPLHRHEFLVYRIDPKEKSLEREGPQKGFGIRITEDTQGGAHFTSYSYADL